MQDMEELLTRSVDEIITPTELQSALAGKQQLRLKLGVDPSAPDIHLGHTVLLKKLRKFQDLGHTVIFLIGDATARIGDPSGRNKTRPVLSEQEITANAQTYLDQVGKILDIDKAEIRKNSEWFDGLTFSDLLELLGKFTVAQLTEREDFKNRLSEGSELGLNELIYPVMQAYDSVQLRCDVEFGGSDQRFNILAGRSLMKKMGLKPQTVFLTKLLIGTDGQQKMSKSLNNYIAVTDNPADMFGKVMSIPDELIREYYELCTDIEMGAIDQTVEDIAGGANPRDTKASLAREIVRLYHGEDEALAAEDSFNRLFREKEKPENIQPVTVAGPALLSDILLQAQLAASKSEARRLIEQGGVRLNDQVQGEDREIEPKDGDVLQVGKRRFAKLQVR